MQKYLVSSKKSSTFASAFAQKTGLTPKAQAMIFEKMSIITRCSTREQLYRPSLVDYEFPLNYT